MDIGEEDPEEDQEMDFEDEEDEWEDDDNSLMAPERDHVHSTFEVRGPSSVVSDTLHLVGHLLSMVASRVTLHYQELRALHVRLDRTPSLVRKVDHLSDDQEDVFDVVQTEVTELWYRVDGYPREQVDTLRVDVDGLHQGAETTRQEVQTLQTALQDARAEILNLQTCLSTSKRSLITSLLRMDERIGALEQRPSGP
ncbi:hypothetical protein Tco_0871582 [Tanacetum coccineum]